MKEIEIIIATYNRENKVCELVFDLIKRYPDVNILVVDSSSEVNHRLVGCENVTYIKTDIANQPYQRYLGYIKSKGEVLLYLDDDMEILSDSWLKDVRELILSGLCVGINFNFKNVNEFLSDKMPKSKLKFISRILEEFNKHLYKSNNERAEIGLCGVRLNRPSNKKPIDWVSGGAFAIKRDALYENFNFTIVDLFSEKLGMGEDLLLGFTSSQIGDILYVEEKYFLHDDQKDSTYTLDHASYAKRVTFSRLYLSFEYVRLTGRFGYNFALLHFLIYCCNRLLGLTASQVLNYDPNRWSLIKGTFEGMRVAFHERRTLMQYKWPTVLCRK